MNPEVLYEDADILVVSKPALLVVHADGRTDEPTLTDWVLERHPELSDVGGLHTLDSGRYAPRAGIVHRLDRETSGVLVIAKHDTAFYALQRQFLAHTVDKQYLAYTQGVPPTREGSIDLPIGRSRRDYRQWTTGQDARGTLRPAHTAYRVIDERGAYGMLELHPKTGRTHQLRVHLRALGCPILCDRRYETPTGLGFERLALHAQSIRLVLPSLEVATFTAPLPLDFLSAHKEFLRG
jgi:23S rRNA pseudouridine1911/1915/1917 synthase